jgi:long-subunit acyl-CoA synthetase (AMP-forming)
MVVLAEHLRQRVAQDAAVRSEVEQSLTALLADVNAQLAPYERLRMLVVAREPWSIENGCLTPTMKIKRGRIEAAVAGQVERWYADDAAVVWP